MDATQIRQALQSSGLFDRDWYLAEHPDVASATLDPLEHYLAYGMLMGRDPGPGFSSEFYLHHNPDVIECGVNPLEHYLLHGMYERRAPTKKQSNVNKAKPINVKDLVAGFYPERDMHGTEIALFPAPSYETSGYNLKEFPSSGYLTLPLNGRITGKSDRPPDVGIHLHLHYPELVNEFCEFLGNISFKFSLYVSVTKNKEVAQIQEKMQQSLPNAELTVKAFPNRGRDVAALVCGFGKELLTHKFIAHIHSKKSPHNQFKADWRKQLLTYLLGSTAYIDRLIRHFQESRNIGMLFPVYHHSLKGQISWGTNFDACSQLAAKIGISIKKERLHLFPAGSMFWARAEALEPLLSAGLSFEDFPEEKAQVDGTPAHAIERLFGEIVHQSGFDLVQVKSEKPYNLLYYYPNKWPFQERRDIASLIADYQQNKKPNNKIVVFTALTGGYDLPVRHDFLDPDIDYVIFSDLPLDNCGFWEVRPIDYWHPDKVRMARRIKTNPHIYLRDYYFTIWIDANVIIRGDIKKYIQALKSQPDTPIAGIPHPQRNCAFQEALSVVESNLDSGDRVTRQMRAYKQLGFPENNGLIETNLLIMNMQHPAIDKLLSAWWSEINKYSHRDQLSLNFVLWKTKTDWVPLMGENSSLRSNPDFAYLGHGANSGYTRASLTEVKTETIDPYRTKNSPSQEEITLDKGAADIIICVHNALEEVTQCLASVIQSKRPVDQIIIIDDASDKETTGFLKAFSDRHEAKLIRNNPPANGYCISANTGMKASTNDYLLLLNSDTIMTRAALENMLEVAEKDPTVGIVGPLSNAASTQSIPDIKSTLEQTAINELPADCSTGDMNQLCEQWAHPWMTPCVPLVHGFCQLIRRNVYTTIGGFDELSFPNGYGEENDFCLRAADAGFNLKIATKAFVFHSKSASYSDDAQRQKLMAAGRLKLIEKHTEDRLNQSIRIMEDHPLLQSIRDEANAYFKRVAR